MILESRGYTLKEEDGKLLVIKFGHRQGEIDLNQLKFTEIKSERINSIQFGIFVIAWFSANAVCCVGEQHFFTISCTFW